MYKKILFFILSFVIFVNLLPSKVTFASEEKYPSSQEIYDAFGKEIYDKKDSIHGEISVDFGVNWLKSHNYNNIIIYACDCNGESLGLAEPDYYAKRYTFIASPYLSYNSDTDLFVSKPPGQPDQIVKLDLVVINDDNDKYLNSWLECTTGHSVSDFDGFNCYYDKIEGFTNVVHFQTGDVDNFDKFDEYGVDTNTYYNPDQLKLGSIVMTYPAHNAYLGGKFESVLSAFDFKVMAKVPFSSDLHDYTVSSADKSFYSLKNKLQSHILDSVDFRVGGKPLGVDNFVYFKFYKTPSEWVKQKYITFEIYGKAIMKSSDVKSLLKSSGVNSKLKVKFSMDCPIELTSKFFYKFNYKNYSIGSHSINLKYYQDTNGDGKDDNTGDTIPQYGQIDNDGDGTPDGDLSDINNPDELEDTSDDGLFSNILKFFTSCIDNLSKFFEVSLKLIQDAQAFITGFPQFVNGLFSCFPNAISTFIALGLQIMIIIAIIKFIRG